MLRRRPLDGEWWEVTTSAGDFLLGTACFLMLVPSCAAQVSLTSQSQHLGRTSVPKFRLNPALADNTQVFLKLSRAGTLLFLFF